jgi:hypothetical protein
VFQPFPGIEWNDEVKESVMEPNRDFILRIKSLFLPPTRSWSSAGPGTAARYGVNPLVEAKFVNIYTIIDDMEGMM